MNDVTRNERTISGALALAMHVLFLALLVFGVSWQQRKPDSAAIVDLWSSLPPLPQPKIEEPPPEVKPQPEPPKPAPKVEPKPVPKAEPKPVVKPDIALKEKLARERKLKEQLEAKKRDEEKKRLAALKEQQNLEEKQRLQKEQDEALRKILEQDTAKAAVAKSLAEYSRQVSNRIKGKIILLSDMQGNPQAEFDVVQIPGGGILSVKLRRSSGVPAYDSAVERAIWSAPPLPPPPAPLTFNDVRELNLKFRLKE